MLDLWCRWAGIGIEGWKKRCSWVVQSRLRKPSGAGMAALEAPPLVFAR